MWPFSKKIDKRGIVEAVKEAIGVGVAYGQRGYVSSSDSALLLSAVYRCVDVISDSVAQLPLEPFKIDKDGNKVKAVNHPSYWLLNREPNSVMSRYTFLKMLVTSRILTGNGFALIHRDKRGNATSLEFLPSERVVIETDVWNTRVQYRVTGYDNIVPAEDMIHLVNFSSDGIHGISTLSYARLTLELSRRSEDSALAFYRSGCNLNGVLKNKAPMGGGGQDKLEKQKEKFNEVFGGQGKDNGGVVVLPGDWEFQPISIKPADAQMLDTRKYNVIDICRFFGVAPAKVFDYSSVAYSTLEAMQISFLTDTLAPHLEALELEFERKLFLPSERHSIDVKFDTTSLLKADKSAQATYYNTLYNIGAMTPNEIRRECNMKPMDGGDELMTQVNMSSLKNIINQKNGEE